VHGADKPADAVTEELRERAQRRSVWLTQLIRVGNQ
jgi:hypothetical protein